jgi:uridine kinase
MSKTLTPPAKIIKRDGAVVKYDRDRISTAIFRAMVSAGKPDRDLAEALAERVEAALVTSYGPDATPSVEDIQDLVERTLVEAGETQVAPLYATYRQKKAEARAARNHSFAVTDHVPYRKIYDVLRWNIARGCDTVPRLNALIAAGRFPKLIEQCDRRFDQEIRDAVALILRRARKVRLVIVAGPSSSGKTTTTCKIRERLEKEGLSLKAINVDHYFFDLERHPRDQFGDYDYEAPQSLDLPLINEHLARLLDGETVRTPHYDFKTGKRTLDVHEMKLEKDEILLLDSLHGLYGDMTSRVPGENVFKLYIETLGQFLSEDGVSLRWADHRLMRRMIRDSLHRNSQPMDTLTHWHYVRRSELRNIIPFIGTVDFLLNSALPYELPILKARVFPHFPKAIRKFRNDPHRQDAYIRARRIVDLLGPLTEVPDDSAVPPDSLLREFIGGSRYPV